MMFNDCTYKIKNEVLNIEKMYGFFIENKNYDFLSTVLSDEIIENITVNFENNRKFVAHLNGENKNLIEPLFCPESHTTYLFCDLICEEEIDICCVVFAHFPGKVWIDQELFVGGDDWINTIFQMHLSKGNHTFIIEALEWNSYKNMNFRFSPFLMEIEDSYSSILSQNYSIKSETIILHNASCINQKYPFEIIVMPTDKLKHKNCEKALVVFEYGNTSEKVQKVVSFYERFKPTLADTIITEESLIGSSIQIYLLVGAEWKYDCSYGFRYNFNNRRTIAFFHHKEDNKLITQNYISSMDGQQELCYVRLPSNYDEKLKYPLFVFISTPRYACRCKIISKYVKQPVIFADVTGRGVTMGSYIGEASISEAISVIKENYSVDEDKVYIVGHSNGAAATWVQAQAFPHLYAGALLISGYTDFNKLDNMNNLRVINVSSPYENMFRGAWELPDKHLRSYPNYTGVLIEGLDHFQLLTAIGKEIFYDDLLQYSRELYPRQINYYTTFNRHLKAYWVTIHSVEYGKYFAEIHVIANESIIKIETKNVSGFTINIPPYVNRENFTVDINGAQNNVINFQEDNLFFEYKDDLFNIVNKPTLCDYRKGTGILDVYLKPMVVITTDFNCADMVATQFSKPISNGYNKEIFVSYPIYSFNEIDALPSNKSVVIIDNNTKSEKLNNIRQLCPIQMDDLGYYYKDQFCKGDYCVMQVFAHPENNEYTILYINTNNIDLYKKNFFTRKLILPSYMNGYHPYLNNEALIFDGKQYFRIYEWGQPIEPVSPK